MTDRQPADIKNHPEQANFEDLPERVRVVINESINDFMQGHFVNYEEFE